VITAVEAELGAVARPFVAQPGRVGPYPSEYAATAAGEVVMVAGGMGMAASAAATATALSQQPFDTVISMGIGGGFDGRATSGDVVVASDVLACQLGADSPEGFRTFGELGLLDTGIATGGAWAGVAERLGAVAGRILTVSTVTGTDARALELAARWSPVAEAMEGWGVWSTAQAYAVVPYEIRTISNRVGRRDRESWDIAGALDALSRAAKTLFEEPLP
jgi:futalosine hydrolase